MTSVILLWKEEEKKSSNQ